MRTTAALVLALTFSLSACGGSEDESPRSPEAHSPSGSDAPQAATPQAPRTVTSVAEELQKAIPTISEIIAITEDNDPNDSIGRPSSYSDAVAMTDTRVSCTTALDVACGAKIELWPDRASAQKRLDYIQGLMKDMPMLGTEYAWVSDEGMLLRVAGELKPSEAKAFEAVFLTE